MARWGWRSALAPKGWLSGSDSVPIITDGGQQCVAWKTYDVGVRVALQTSSWSEHAFLVVAF
eukprot:1336739-Karenia_brevis.AAC.1